MVSGESDSENDDNKWRWFWWLRYVLANGVGFLNKTEGLKDVQITIVSPRNNSCFHWVSSLFACPWWYSFVRFNNADTYINDSFQCYVSPGSVYIDTAIHQTSPNIYTFYNYHLFFNFIIIIYSLITKLVVTCGSYLVWLFSSNDLNRIGISSLINFHEYSTNFGRHTPDSVMTEIPFLKPWLIYFIYGHKSTIPSPQDMYDLIYSEHTDSRIFELRRGTYHLFLLPVTYCHMMLHVFS